MFTLYIDDTVTGTYRKLDDAMIARWYAMGFYGLRSTPARLFILPHH
jgi:hypothetical protein